MFKHYLLKLQKHKYLIYAKTNNNFTMQKNYKLSKIINYSVLFTRESFIYSIAWLYWYLNESMNLIVEQYQLSALYLFYILILLTLLKLINFYYLIIKIKLCCAYKQIYNYIFH